jgi:hypothetical protein
MGTNIPPKPSVDQILWFETHIGAWTAAPTTFGTTAAACTALQGYITNARKVYNDAQATREASKNATLAETAGVNNMLFSGRAMVNTIKAFIENSHNDTLWAQAGLSPENPPGVAPDPVAPTDMSVTLTGSGNLVLNWKASQPTGVSRVVYSIKRAIDSADYVLLNTVGKKTYTDMTVPIGTHMVRYIITASHGDQTSPESAVFTVQFGRESGGGLTITSTQTGPVKMAA